MNSFREFLFSSMHVDGKGRLFGSRPVSSIGRLCLEMANKNDVKRAVVHLDDDDIEFMRQFPHEFWDKALKQRYDMLFRYVKMHQDIRRGVGHDDLKHAIYKALHDQSDEAWNELSRLAGDEADQRHMNRTAIETLRRGYPPEWSARILQQPNGKSILKNLAEHEAHSHIRLKVPDLPDPPEEAEFKFLDTTIDPETGKRSKRKMKHGQFVSYRAKPYLNRLFHKLEQTQGVPHLPSSGLQGVGKYGLDMSDPVNSIDYDESVPEQKDSPGATAGMTFPTFKQIQHQVHQFMIWNGHRMFGDFDANDPSIVWKKAKVSDTETVGYVQDKLTSKYRNELIKKVKSDSSFAKELANKYPGIDREGTRINTEATKLAKEELVKLAKDNKLVGPPVPGIPEKDRSATLDKNGKIVNPPLYLPGKEETVTLGNGEKIKRWIPLVNPSHHFRQATDEDYKTEEYQDENGETKQRKVLKDSERARGHAGNFLKVEDDEFRFGDQQGVKSAGSLTMNQNTEDISHLPEEHPEWREKHDKHFGGQRRVNYVVRRSGEKRDYHLLPGETMDMYEDFVDGILRCIHTGLCAGATPFDRKVLLQSLPEIHAIIYQTARQNISNKDLETPESRKRYAEKKTGNIAQNNLGAGTRRQKAYSAEALMALKDTSVASGTFGSPGDRNTQKLYLLRKVLKDIEIAREEAKEIDDDSANFLQIAMQRNSESTVKNLQTVLLKRKNLVEKTEEMLTVLYLFSNPDKTEEDAEKYASDQIASWIDEKKQSSRMIEAMLRLPMVQDAMRKLKQSGHLPEEGLKMTADHDLAGEINAAKKMLEDDWARDMRTYGGNVSDENIKRKYGAETGRLSDYVMKTVRPQILGLEGHKWLATEPEKLKQVLAAAQGEINAKLGKTRPAASPAIKPRQMPEPKHRSWVDLRREKTPENIFHLATDTDFHQEGIMPTLMRTRADLEERRQHYTPEDFTRAHEAISSAIKARGGQQ